MLFIKERIGAILGQLSIVHRNGKTVLINKDGVQELTKEEAMAHLDTTQINKLEFTRTNANPIVHLVDQMEEHRNNKTSPYDERVVAHPIYFKIKHKATPQGTYISNIKYKFSLIGSEKEKFVAHTDITGLKSNVLLTQEFFQRLLTLAFSGIYATPHDLDAYYAELAAIYSIDRKNAYYCEECQENFQTVEDFITHLETSKHYDSIYEEFPHFAPLQNIRPPTK